MLSQNFLNGRLLHLQNKQKAVKESLANYGKFMPEQHKQYKIATMLPAIESAIRKISRSPKNYGICSDCGEVIAKKRLLLLPESEKCTTCQSKKEE